MRKTTKQKIKKIMIEKWKDPIYWKHMSDVHKGKKFIGGKWSEKSKKKRSRMLKMAYKSGKIKPPWLGKKRGVSPKRNRKLVSCSYCGKQFETIPYFLRKGWGKFCSSKCYGKSITGEKSPFWQGGKSFEPYTTDWTKTLKKAIKERDNYICQLCSHEGTHIHHIDYNKKNCNPDNLITLCMGCNSRVNFRRDYWQRFFTEIIGAKKNTEIRMVLIK